MVRWRVYACVVMAMILAPMTASAWSVAWRRSCRREVSPHGVEVLGAELLWCGARFDGSSGRYLGDAPRELGFPDVAVAPTPGGTWVLPTPEGRASLVRADVQGRTHPGPRRLTNLDVLSLCDGQLALAVEGARTELRAVRDGRTVAQLSSSPRYTLCARSTDGATLALANARGVTMHVRRGDRWVAVARWDEPDLSAMRFVANGTLIGERGDETLLTAWSASAQAPASARATLPRGERVSCRERGDLGVPWMPNLTVYDVPPRAPGREHGLLGACGDESVFATDAVEFGHFTSDTAWAAAVARRYALEATTPRVSRTPLGARMAAWSTRVPRTVCGRVYEARVIEEGDLLYRLELERVQTPTTPPMAGCGPEDVARERHRARDLVRALFGTRSDRGKPRARTAREMLPWRRCAGTPSIKAPSSRRSRQRTRERC